MKNLLHFSIVFLAMSLFACQDAKDDVRKNISDLAYYRNIGKQIPNEQGQRWLELYRSKNNMNTSGRIDLLGYSLSKENLADMSNSVAGFTGVAFHHAKDYFGQHHFLAIPIGESLQVWDGSAGKIIIDTNTDTQISGSTARLWAANYEASHPNDYWFHYFGRNVFDEMNLLTFFDAMQIEPALSDLDLSPQLLLIVSDLDLGLLGLSLGRTKTEETVVYDVSSACPPCAVE
jgi:hypothetical protein